MEAAEYHSLNSHIRELTDVRVALRTESVGIPFDTLGDRDAGGMPVQAPGDWIPRSLYRDAEKAIVEAERAIMRIRDRNGWSGAYEQFGKVAAMRER